jgi:hypothetical protein
MMNNDSFNRLAATLDNQAMVGVCHHVPANPPTRDSLIKTAFSILRGLVRRNERSGEA